MWHEDKRHRNSVSRDVLILFLLIHSSGRRKNKNTKNNDHSNNNTSTIEYITVRTATLGLSGKCVENFTAAQGSGQTRGSDRKGSPTTASTGIRSIYKVYTQLNPSRPVRVRIL